MTRKGLFAGIIFGLGGVILPAAPLLAQYGTFPPGPCSSPPKFKPFVVSKYPGPMPPMEAMPKPPAGQPLAKPQDDPPNLPNSSGPLPPVPGLPNLPTAQEHEPPPLPEPKYFPNKETPPPFSIPKGFYPSAAKKQPQNPISDPLIDDPMFKPAGLKEELKKNSSAKPEVKEEIKKNPPQLEPIPELPPKAPLPKPDPKVDVPDFAEPPLGGEGVPPLTPGVKPDVPQLKPIDLILPSGKPSSPWVIKVEVIKTVTHLIASSKNVEFHVQCQNLKVQSPSGDIQADGDIKVMAGGLDLSCEKLTISWQNDWVLLEGKVRLQTQKDGQQLELTGDKLQLKLTTLKFTTYYGPSPVAEPITPAKIINPQPAAPAGSDALKLKSFYQRVTQDE